MHKDILGRHFTDRIKTDFQFLTKSYKMAFPLEVFLSLKALKCRD